MPEAQSSRILLVEPDETSRAIRATALGDRGYDVDSVASLAELPSVWREARYGLVLLSLGRSGTSLDMTAWRGVQRDYPSQQFLFILTAPERLCPMYLDGEQIRDEERSESFLDRVEAALGIPLAAK
jgi:CheY-like chemotaxis protein